MEQFQLDDPRSQRNGERALWIGDRLWLLLNNALGPGIYKPDPAGEYTKRYLGETVYSFGKSFSTVIFGFEDRLQKVKSNQCGWETKESRAWTPNLFGNQLVYRGFSNHHASRNIWFSSKMMTSLMWSKKTCTTSILAIILEVLQQIFDRFLPRSQPYLDFMFYCALFCFVFITYLITHVPSWMKMAGHWPSLLLP